MSVPEVIELAALQAWLEEIEGELPNGVSIDVRVRTRRITRYAKGLITATLPSPFGPLVISSGWEAFRQARPQDGWCVLPLADAAGEGIESAIPVMDGVEACGSCGENLSQFAWDFWSMLEIELWVLPAIKLRPACRPSSALCHKDCVVRPAHPVHNAHRASPISC